MRGLHFDSYAEFELFSYIIICSESWNTSNQNSVSLFLSYFELKSKTFNKSNLFTFLLISLFLFDPCCFMRPASKAWSKTNWEIGEKKKMELLLVNELPILSLRQLISYLYYYSSM